MLLFGTCYGRHHEPALGEDLVAVFEHNGVPVRLMSDERCCGMPKLELGDLPGVERLEQFNIPRLLRWVEAGWDIVAPVPSCVLMFKQELPLLFAGDGAVARVRDATYDPFEYLPISACRISASRRASCSRSCRKRPSSPSNAVPGMTVPTPSNANST